MQMRADLGSVKRFATFTDFGPGGPYTGQMHAVLSAEAPGLPVIELLSLAPAFSPKPAAYLLASLAEFMPGDTAFVAVVDPGVGGDRGVLALHTHRHWFIGPDNGLLALAARRAGQATLWRVDWRPPHLSDSFHGRDLFAPLAARIARGALPLAKRVDRQAMQGADWPDDLAQVIYIDPYGNAFTGLRADQVARDRLISVTGRRMRFARTFSAVDPGQAFWYANSNGLVELAVNGGNAAQVLGLGLGEPVRVEAP